MQNNPTPKDNRQRLRAMPDLNDRPFTAGHAGRPRAQGSAPQAWQAPYVGQRPRDRIDLIGSPAPVAGSTGRSALRHRIDRTMQDGFVESSNRPLRNEWFNNILFTSPARVRFALYAGATTTTTSHETRNRAGRPCQDGRQTNLGHAPGQVAITSVIYHGICRTPLVDGNNQESVSFDVIKAKRIRKSVGLY
jgi:hypothetical protein